VAGELGCMNGGGCHAAVHMLVVHATTDMSTPVTNKATARAVWQRLPVWLTDNTRQADSQRCTDKLKTLKH